MAWLSSVGAKADLARLVLLVVIALMVSGPAPAARAVQNGEAFGLHKTQRVYDETGDSLTGNEIASLESQLEELLAIGANGVVYVRALPATPEETLDQVEALQQEWVAVSGVNEADAFAILINRNPDDPHDARAGIFVGSTFDDGNVPEEEQRAIVDDALIPPLRDGDVYGSLQAGLERFESSVVNGPPQSRFEAWSAEAGGSWLPWATTLLAAACALGAGLLFRGRTTIETTEPAPTMTRPGTLAPAVAGALVAGSPQSTAFAATVLDLAGRGAVWIEAVSEGGRFSKPKIQVRLIDEALVRGEVEAAVWEALEKRSEDGVVSTSKLPGVARDQKNLKQAIKTQLEEAGWLDEQATSSRSKLIWIVVVAVVGGIATLVIGAAGEQKAAFVAGGLLIAVALLCLYLFYVYSPLSQMGQRAALPWISYRDGIKNAAKSHDADLDLNAVLADSVALNIGSSLDDQLKAASEAGEQLRAFASGQTGTTVLPVWLYWTAINASIGASGSSTSTVSGGGVGGGGGAAGST